MEADCAHKLPGRPLGGTTEFETVVSSASSPAQNPPLSTSFFRKGYCSHRHNYHHSHRHHYHLTNQNTCSHKHCYLKVSDGQHNNISLFKTDCNYQPTDEISLVKTL